MTWALLRTKKWVKASYAPDFTVENTNLSSENAYD
jgi:hypothetical protein